MTLWPFSLLERPKLPDLPAGVDLHESGTGQRIVSARSWTALPVMFFDAHYMHRANLGFSFWCDVPVIAALVSQHGFGPFLKGEDFYTLHDYPSWSLERCPVVHTIHNRQTTVDVDPGLEMHFLVINRGDRTGVFNYRLHGQAVFGTWLEGPIKGDPRVIIDEHKIKVLA